MDKIKHSVDGLSDGDAILMMYSRSVPHRCSDPQCPGDVNRRKLEAYMAIKAAYDEPDVPEEDFIRRVVAAISAAEKHE
jgi:hypothetical protein